MRRGGGKLQRVAEGRDVIHRDIEANNIMVTAAGQVKIFDLSPAKLSDEQTSSRGVAKEVSRSFHFLSHALSGFCDRQFCC